MAFHCPALERLTRDGRVTGVLVDGRTWRFGPASRRRKKNLRPITEGISRSVPRLISLSSLFKSSLELEKEPWLER